MGIRARAAPSLELDLQEPCQAPGRAFLVGQESNDSACLRKLHKGASERRLSSPRGFIRGLYMSFPKGLYKTALYEPIMDLTGGVLHGFIHSGSAGALYRVWGITGLWGVGLAFRDCRLRAPAPGKGSGLRIGTSLSMQKLLQKHC